MKLEMEFSFNDPDMVGIAIINKMRSLGVRVSALSIENDEWDPKELV